MAHYNIPDNAWHGYTPQDKIVGQTLNSLLKYSGLTIKQLQEQGVFVFPPIHKDVDVDNHVFSLNKATENCTFYTNNVVGFIGISDVQLNICSRFDDYKDNKLNNNFLTYMIARAAGLNVNLVNLESKGANSSVFNLLELFFPRLLKDALSQGIYKEYKRVEYNDSRVKGPIDISRHIHKNIPFNGKIAYHAREYSMDNKVTQLIRHTIEYIRNSKGQFKAILTNDPETTVAVQKLCNLTPMYNSMERRRIVKENQQNKVSHPYYTKYRILQDLCLKILQGKKASWGNSKEKVYGVLIDAAWLWEEYIAKVLLDNKDGLKLKHYIREGEDYRLFKKDGHEFQQIIPDYYDEENKVVADAKYIPLHRFDHLNADRACAVYYKTLMYMLRFDCSNGLLLHPCSLEDVKQDLESSENYDENTDSVSRNQSVVYNTYEILQPEGSGKKLNLHKVGLIIANEENYSKFVIEMRERETEFVEKIKELLKK